MKQLTGKDYKAELKIPRPEGSQLLNTNTALSAGAFKGIRTSLALLGLSISNLQAIGPDSVNLKWNANPEPDIGGYKIYIGTESRNYNVKTTDVGNVIRGKVTGLNPNTIYFAAVTAYFTNDNESEYSNQIVFRTAADTINSPLNINSQSQSLGTITFNWVAGEPNAEVLIYFGTKPGQASRVVRVPVGQTTATITGLRSNETYYFTMSSSDPVSGKVSARSPVITQAINGQGSGLPEGSKIPVSASFVSNQPVPVVNAAEPVKVIDAATVTTRLPDFSYQSFQLTLQGETGQNFWIYKKPDLSGAREVLVHAGTIPAEKTFTWDGGPIIDQRGFFRVLSETRD